MTAFTRADDERVLRILDLHVVEGLTATEIGARLGLSKGAVCGLMHRVEVADVKHEVAAIPGAAARQARREWIAVDYGRGAAVRSPGCHWSRASRVRT